MILRQYFEEYEPDTKRESLGRTITEADIVLHAGQTGDFYPHHMDKEWCKTQEFQERIAHGTLIFSVAIGMTAGVINPLAMSYGYDRLRFLKPVFIGDTIRATVTVKEKRDHKKPGYGVVSELVEVFNQKDELVLVCEHLLLAEKQAPSARGIPLDGQNTLPKPTLIPRSSMKVFQLTGVKKHHVIEHPEPVPRAGEVVIEVKSVVTCPQWDQRLYLKGENPLDMKVDFPQPPGWPGHEAAGVVHSTGESVTKVKKGDAVTIIYTRIPAGDETGLYAPLARVLEADVVKLKGKNINFDGAASYGMLRDIVYSVGKFGDVRGKVAAVTGLGSGGLMAVQVLKALGAKSVLGIDPNPARRELVLKEGYCEAAADPREASAGGLLDDAGLQIGLDCSGIPSAMQFLLDHASEHVVIFGVPHGDIQFGFRHWGSEKKLQGVNINRATEAETELARELMESGKVDTAIVATHRGTFDKYDEAVELLRTQEAIKVYFRPSEELLS